MHLSALWPWLFWSWTASEVVLAVSTHTRRSEGALQDRGSLFVLWIVIVGSITACEWMRHLVPAADFDGSPWLKPLTVLLMIAGLLIRWTAILSLGRSFSVNVAIHKAQTVYTGGLYRFVRHPSYLGLVLIFAALGLRERNGVGLAIMLIAPVAALLYRVRIEETALQDAFGAEYTAYCRTAKRLIPGIY